MKDGPSKGSGAGGRPGPDREALRRQVRHPYITRQEPRRRKEGEEDGPTEDESPRPPSS